MRKLAILIALVLAALALAACSSTPQLEASALFPPQVGGFTRMSGPGIDADTGVDVATYEAAEGTVVLHVKQVPEGQASAALGELPPAATDIVVDPALGQRQGMFFNFAGEFHAAWSNGDWVFVTSATTDLARRSFLASYSY